MKQFSFARPEWALQRASAAGTLAAAQILAAALRNSGHAATVAPRLDGTATVTLEGAGAVAREFGSGMVAARPVLGPALAESRAAMTVAIARAMSDAVKGVRS